MLCVHLLVTHRHWAHSCVVVVCRVADFAWAWINAVSRGTMSLYVQRILEIPQLTNQGSLQLAADIRTATTTHPPYLCFALLYHVSLIHLLAGRLPLHHPERSACDSGQVPCGHPALA